MKEIYSGINELGDEYLAAVICKDFPEPVAEFLRSIQVNILLHGWEHRQYSELPAEEVTKDLKRGILFIEKTFGKRPTEFVPPWEKTSEVLISVCQKLGLSIHHSEKWIMGYKPDENVSGVFFHLWDWREIPVVRWAIAYQKLLRKCR